MSKIGPIIEVARESGFGRFNTLSIIDLHNGLWKAVLHSDTEAPGSMSPHGTGESAEAAIEAVALRLTEWTMVRRDSAAKQRSESDMMLAKLGAVTP